jgi:hypothetical protein
LFCDGDGHRATNHAPGIPHAFTARLASGVCATEGGDTAFGTSAVKRRMRSPLLAEIRIARQCIDRITSPDISMMPEGLER